MNCIYFSSKSAAVDERCFASASQIKRANRSARPRWPISPVASAAKRHHPVPPRHLPHLLWITRPLAAGRSRRRRRTRHHRRQQQGPAALGRGRRPSRQCPVFTLRLRRDRMTKTTFTSPPSSTRRASIATSRDRRRRWTRGSPITAASIGGRGRPGTSSAIPRR